jgi:uncharacterized membrane protein YvbJ
MPPQSPTPPPPDFCPNCGAEVPDTARACPACGACHQTGWSEQARYDALDLPNQDFDHAEFERNEFGPQDSRRSRPRWWWVIVVVLLLAWIIGLMT